MVSIGYGYHLLFLTSLQCTESRSVKRRLYFPLMSKVLGANCSTLLKCTFTFLLFSYPPACVFDGAKVYSSVELPVALGRVHEIEHRGKVYPVTIVSQKRLVLTDQESEETLELVTAMNVVLKKVCKTKFTL